MADLVLILDVVFWWTGAVVCCFGAIIAPMLLIWQLANTVYEGGAAVSSIVDYLRNRDAFKEWQRREDSDG